MKETHLKRFRALSILRGKAMLSVQHHSDFGKLPAIRCFHPRAGYDSVHRSLKHESPIGKQFQEKADLRLALFNSN